MTKTSSRPRLRYLLAAMLITALAATFSACGGEDEEPVADVTDINGLTTKVKLDKGFVEALGKLKLEAGRIGIGKLEGANATFPITDGNIKYFDPNGEVRPFVQGELKHDGSGLRLNGGGVEVMLTDFVIDPAKSTLKGKVIADGKEEASDALLFNLDGSTLKPLKTNKKKGTATLAGTTVTLSSEAADLLNKTFGTMALEGGLKIGTSTITINTG